jgi:hypothetical protein
MHRSQQPQHIPSLEHRHGAIADQQVRPGRPLVDDPARHRGELASERERGVGGVHRVCPDARLDDHGHLRERGDQVVACQQRRAPSRLRIGCSRV